MQKASTKRALWASAVALVLCLAMLVGVTLAWFSDVVSNKGNKIEAGTLQVGMYVAEDDTYGTLPEIGAADENGWRNLKNDAAPIFTMGTPATPAQPGDARTKYIAIRNEGSLALKYYLNFSTKDGGLGSAVTFTFTQVYPVASATAVTYSGTQLNGEKANGASHVKGEYTIYKMDLLFNESAGNTYQGKTYAVDVNLVATQDKTQAIGALKLVSTEQEFRDALAENNATVSLTDDIVVNGDVSVTDTFFNLNLNGYNLTVNGNFSVTNNAIGTYDYQMKLAGGTMVVTGDFKMEVPNAAVNFNGTPADSDDIDIAAGKYVFKTASHSLNVNATVVNYPFETAATPANLVIEGGAVNVVDVKIGIITVPETASQDVTISVIGGSVAGLVDNSPGDVNVTVNGDVAPTGIKWDGTVATAFEGGTGTEEDPYNIANGAQLAYLAQQVNAGISYAGVFFKQTANIDMDEQNWVPIGENNGPGNNSKYFAGNYNGNGCTIISLRISPHHTTTSSPAGTGTHGSVGLFGTVNGAAIKNLHIYGADVVSSRNIYNVNYAGRSDFGTGALAGYVIGPSVIENCSLKNIKVEDKRYNPNPYYTGGVIGSVGDGSTAAISNVKAESITVKSLSGSTGGFVGATWKGTFTNCQVLNVNVSVGYDNNGLKNTGGFVGASGWHDRLNSGATFINCSVSGTDNRVSGMTYAGGFGGSLQSSTKAENCDVENVEVLAAYGGAAGFSGSVTHETTVKNSTVKNAKVSGNDTLGGFVGMAVAAHEQAPINMTHSPMVESCTATQVQLVAIEKVSSLTGLDIGGFVGRASGANIKTSTLAGTVAITGGAATRVGKFAGQVKFETAYNATHGVVSPYQYFETNITGCSLAASATGATENVGLINNTPDHAGGTYRNTNHTVEIAS